jgi:arginyl-tRNA synthetase
MKADWVLYVVDAGQSLHFELIFEAAKLAGILDPTKHRVEHVAFGVVHDASGKKFKTRSGETVKLQDLLDKAVQHAATIAEEKRAESHEPGSSDVSGKHEVILRTIEAVLFPSQVPHYFTLFRSSHTPPLSTPISRTAGLLIILFPLKG